MCVSIEDVLLHAIDSQSNNLPYTKLCLFLNLAKYNMHPQWIIHGEINLQETISKLTDATHLVWGRGCLNATKFSFSAM